MSDFVYKGMPSSLIIHDTRMFDTLTSESGLLHQGVTHLFTGNLTNYVLLTPAEGNLLILKGISVTGDGNTCKVYIKRSETGEIIFPSYFSAQVKGSPSSAFNRALNANESVLITTTDRGTSETFVGVTYIEVDSNYQNE